MSEPDIIDRAALNNLLDMVNGDTAFLDEMIDAYFNDTPQQLAAMRQALAAGDVAELRRAAHALKSTSANFGALRLSAMCKELEALAKAGVLDGAVELVAQIEAEYDTVRPALLAMRPKG